MAGTRIRGKSQAPSLDGTEAVPLSPDSFATTQQIADLGGSGLPPQWSDGGNGDVTATVDDPTKTPLEVVGLADQEEPLLVLTADTPFGSADVFLIRQSAGQGGGDIFSVDDSGEVNLHIVDPNASGLTIDDDTGIGDGPLLSISAPMAAGGRLFLAEFHANDLPGGGQTVTQFDGGLRFQYDNGPVSGAFFIFDPAINTTTWKAQPGQTLPLIVAQNENGDDVARVLPSGAVGTSAGEPADADINPGECFRWFDPTNGAAAVRWKAKTLDGTVVTGSDALT